MSKASNLAGFVPSITPVNDLSVGVLTATSFSGNATGLAGTPNITVGFITATGASISGNVDVGGNVSIAGTLTYEDVTNIDSIGIVTARSGIILGPTANTIQLGTGTTISSPSSNTFTVSTNGSERIRVDSSGRLAIGTTSPSQKLEVNGNIRILNENNLQLANTGDVQFLNAAGTSYSTGIIGSSDNMILYTTDLERARIDSSGRLLVGTSTSYGVPATIAGPAATLTTGTGSYSVLSIADTNSMAAGVGGGIAFQGNDGVNGLVAFSQVQGFKENNTSGNFAGGLSFSTRLNGAGLTERMRIDSSGRLLVGTSSSASAGNAQYALLQVRGNSFSTANNAILNIGRGEAATSITSGEDIGNITFTDSSGNEFAEIKCTADAGAGSGDYPGRLVFSTTADGASSPTEKLRIDNEGTIQADGRNGTSAQTYYSILPSPGTSRNHFLGNTVGVGTWTLQGNGTSTWTSDERRKKNIETTRDGYLEDLTQLRVVKYNWNVQSDDEPKELGLIAQEVEQVFPGLVIEADEPQEGDDYKLKSVKFSVLPFMLLKALQEAAAKIETLEAKVAALEAS